ncbi:hypothetical protein [Streptomyces virginiae]
MNIVIRSDVAFDGSGVPGQGESDDAGGEGVEAGQVVLLDVVGPFTQALTSTLGAQGRGRPDRGG